MHGIGRRMLGRRSGGMLFPLVLGMFYAAGCGDGDDAGPDASGGTSGSSGASGASGSGGTSGRGGSPAGGRAGEGGEPSGVMGGSGGEAAAASDAGSGGQGAAANDAGGAGQGAAGNDAGSAGQAGGGPVEYASITKESDSVVVGVHDLRGLSFAADGKLYGSGYLGATFGAGSTATTPDDRQIVVARFNADGTLDDDFADAGLFKYNFVARVEGMNDGQEESIGIVELANGDVVAQLNLRGESGMGQDVALLKLSSAGVPVAAFGSDRGIPGLKIVDLGWTTLENANYVPPAGATAGNSAPSDTAWGLSLDSGSSPGSEKLVINGFGTAEYVATGTQRTDNDRYVARVMASDGTPDSGFANAGVFTLNTAATLSDGGRRAIVEADGAILSSGYTNFTGVGNYIVLIRLLPTGAVDPAFGFGFPASKGVARANPFFNDGGVAECYNAAKQSNGRYVTTGYGSATSANAISSYGYASSVAPDLVSFGILPNGIDAGYGIQGTVAFQSEEEALGTKEDRGRDLIVLPDDRIVQVGRYNTSPSIFVQLPAGSLDESVNAEETPGRFDSEPLLFEDLATPARTTSTSHFFRVALSADGKRIAASTNNHPNGVRLAILAVADD